MSGLRSCWLLHQRVCSGQIIICSSSTLLGSRPRRSGRSAYFAVKLRDGGRYGLDCLPVRVLVVCGPSETSNESGTSRHLRSLDRTCHLPVSGRIPHVARFAEFPLEAVASTHALFDMQHAVEHGKTLGLGHGDGPPCSRGCELAAQSRGLKVPNLGGSCLGLGGFLAEVTVSYYYYQIHCQLTTRPPSSAKDDNPRDCQPNGLTTTSRPATSSPYS